MFRRCCELASFLRLCEEVASTCITSVPVRVSWRLKYFAVSYCTPVKSTQPVFRRQASPSNSGPELNSPSRDMGFFRAGTEPARSALYFPDPRLFAIASSFHLNSFVVLRGSILQLTFHISFVVEQWSAGWNGNLCGAATLQYAASDHSLGQAAVFPWTPSVKVQSFAPSPQRVLVKMLTRDVTRCLDDTHIFQTSDRIKAPGMCVSTI